MIKVMDLHLLRLRQVPGVDDHASSAIICHRGLLTVPFRWVGPETYI